MRFFLFLLFLSSCTVTKQKIPVIETRLDTVRIYERDSFFMNEEINPKILLKEEIEEDFSPTPKVVYEIRTVKDVKVLKRTIKTTIDHGIGLVAFSIPDTMVLGRCYEIVVRINRDTADKMTVSENLQESRISIVKTSSRMEVSLVDNDPIGAFKIVKINTDVQLVDTLDYTEWRFNVCPIKNGNCKLNLVISIIREDGKKEIVYDNNIVVKNNEIHKIKTFWEKYWQWLFSTLIIPLAVWLWKKKDKKEKN